MLLWIS